MKRFVCMLLAIVLCFALVLSAYAADFVPSIGDKDEPDVTLPSIPVECELLVTSVAEALSIPEDMREDYHKELISVYNQITGGTMTLPIPEDMVVRDLFDISYICHDYHDDSNISPAMNIWFDVGIDANDVVKVLVYHGGQWVEMPSTNHGDGYVSAAFSMISPVAICVEVVADETTQPTTPGGETIPTTPAKPGGSPETGDNAQILLWALLLLASFAAVILLLLSKRRKKHAK